MRASYESTEEASHALETFLASPSSIGPLLLKVPSSFVACYPLLHTLERLIVSYSLVRRSSKFLFYFYCSPTTLHL